MNIEEEKNELKKPISLVYAEFVSSIRQRINECPLPLFVIENVLKDAYMEVRALSRQQLEQDIQNYEEQLHLSQQLDIQQRSEKNE